MTDCSGIRVRVQFAECACTWACVHGRSREAREGGLIVARSFVEVLVAQSVSWWWRRRDVGVAIYFVACGGYVRWWIVRLDNRLINR